MNRPSEDVDGTKLEVLRFIDGYIRDNGWAPSYREIMAGTSLRSTSTTYGYMHRLAFDGLIRLGVGARQIALTDKGREALDGDI